MVDSRAWAEKIQNEHGASCDAKVEKSTLKKRMGNIKKALEPAWESSQQPKFEQQNKLW